ncbi:MAG: hypothetical protein JMDDDDMK_05022 [Acidobacteria bacterium]|nr:hypothetical protein [Acidobacteriota bacterium]
MASVSFTALFKGFDRYTNPIMVQADCSPQENSNGQARSRTRLAGFAITILVLALLSASCASLVKSRDNTIPKLLTPLAEAKFDDLTKQLQQFTNLQSLRSSQVYIKFIDAQASEKWPEADAILALQRPDKIRLLIQAPTIKTKIADMASESNHFKVAIFSGGYRRFLIGTNDADYSQWKAKLGDAGKQALASARPFHFTDALMMRPLALNDPRFVMGIEEALVEEPDTRQGAKKGARILRSFYVISELEVSPVSEGGQGVSRVLRRFWFDRANGARFARQQIFDQQGQLATEVQYSGYMKLNTDDAREWPSVVWVSRPHEGYSARLTFNEEKFEINAELPATTFTLENADKLPETDLDKPEKKP